MNKHEDIKRLCLNCKKELAQRTDEVPSNFRKRKYCNSACYHKDFGRRRLGWVGDYDKFASKEGQERIRNYRKD